MQVISPMSMSGVVLDAPEATLLLSTMAVALSNSGRWLLTLNDHFNVIIFEVYDMLGRIFL